MHVTYLATTTSCGKDLASVISLLTPNLPLECIQADPEHTKLLGIHTTTRFHGLRRSARQPACTPGQGEAAGTCSRALGEDSSLAVHIFPYDSPVSPPSFPSRTTPASEPRQETPHRLLCHPPHVPHRLGLDSVVRLQLFLSGFEPYRPGHTRSWAIRRRTGPRRRVERYKGGWRMAKSGWSGGVGYGQSPPHPSG